MHVTASIFIKILGWLNPRKWLTMFSKWWLKTESLDKEREYNLKSKELDIEEQKLKLAELEANRKKPTWCPACDINMITITTKLRLGYGTQRSDFQCPKCGLIKQYNNKAN